MLFALRGFLTWVWTGSFLVGPTSQASRSSTQTAPSCSSSSSAGSAWMKENFQKPKTLHWRSVRRSCRYCSRVLFLLKRFPYCSSSRVLKFLSNSQKKKKKYPSSLAEKCFHNLYPDLSLSKPFCFIYLVFTGLNFLSSCNHKREFSILEQHKVMLHCDGKKRLLDFPFFKLIF